MHKDEMLLSIEGLIEGGFHPITNLANVAAFLWQELPDINWVGFYLLDKGALWLGPFHGKPACTRIAPGKGVCGYALSHDKTMLVDDVHTFAGHIACDAASRSELVVPLHDQGQPIGVLDLDSPSLARFTDEDRQTMEAVARLLETHCDFTQLGYDLQTPAE